MPRNVIEHKQKGTLELLCRLCATSFTILSSYSFIGHYMFRPNRPSSRIQVVMVWDSAGHCNTGFFPPIVVVSGYFGYVGYHQFYLSLGSRGYLWFCWLWLT
jgi:hypothetical protein